MAYWCFPMDDGVVVAGGALRQDAGWLKTWQGCNKRVYLSPAADFAHLEESRWPPRGTVCRPKMAER